MSRTKEIAHKTIFAAFKILKDADGSMRGKDVVDIIEKTIPLTEYDKQRYEQTGNVRWQSILHFFTIDCIKAGFMRKKKGVWYLTEEGEKAIDLGPEKLLDAAVQKYREWKIINKQNKIEENDTEIEEEALQLQSAILEKYETDALDGIRKYLINKNPYEFQDIVAALLGVMGYHISFISQKGRDGGIDIIAYTDPLGVNQPRIIVQVKHRPDAQISSDDIQRLSGTMKRSSDVGIFVTSGSFSSQAMIEARTSNKHVELIDFERFISLWQEYYNKMTDEQKNMIPLYPIYFLGSNE